MSHQNTVPISVIIPVYNQSKYLKRCLDSVLNQSFNQLEIILINDGSTDESPQLCDEFAKKDDRITVIHQNNGGVSNARNSGLKIARGEYVHFMDSDDFLDDGFYNDLYNLAQSREADIICSEYYQEYRDKKGEFFLNTNATEQLTMTRNEAIVALLSGKRVSYSTCDKLFKRNIIADIKFNEHISHNEDFLFVYEAVKRISRLFYTSHAYFHYCHNPKSAIRTSFNHKRMTAIDVHEIVLEDIKHNITGLYKEARTTYCKVAIYTRKLMEKAGYNDSKDIMRIKKILRNNFIFILFSKLAVGYKLLTLQYILR